MGVWGLCLGPVRTQQLQELGTATWLFLSAGGKQNRTWMKLWFCKQAWEQKQCSPVAVFAVYTANYRDSFSGASLCTLGSLIPSAPSRTLHLTNNLGSRSAATGKASSSSSCSAVFSRACTAWTALECCTEDALGTDSAGCGTRGSALINPCAQRLLQCSFGGLSHCDGASEVEITGRISWRGNLRCFSLGFDPGCVISDLNLWCFWPKRFELAREAGLVFEGRTCWMRAGRRQDEGVPFPLSIVEIDTVVWEPAVPELKGHSK